MEQLGPALRLLSETQQVAEALDGHEVQSLLHGSMLLLQAETRCGERHDIMFIKSRAKHARRDLLRPAAR